jgi:hypothetical protein
MLTQNCKPTPPFSQNVFLVVKTFKVFLSVFGITLPKPKSLQCILENGMLASTSVPFSKMPLFLSRSFLP